MGHPLDFVARRQRKPAFLFFLALTILLWTLFLWLDAPLKTQAAPAGIVSFEVAGSAQKAEQILASWGALNESVGVGMFQPARIAAAFGLGLDYLFMPAYALALSLGILLSGGKWGWMGWLPFAAAGFDAMENFALFQMLMGEPFATWPGVAALCAWTKFTLLAAGLVYAGWSVVARSRRA